MFRNCYDGFMRPHTTKATVIALIAAASMCFIFASSVQAQSLQTNSSVKFQKAQEALEHQIIARQVQLALLGTEIANAANVTILGPFSIDDHHHERADRARDRRQ